MKLNTALLFLYSVVKVNSSNIPGINDSPSTFVLHSDFGSASHIRGILELAEILIQRGHKCIYAAASARLVYAKGYNVSTHQLYTSRENNQAASSNSKDESASKPTTKAPLAEPAVINMFIEGYHATYQSLTDFVRENQPHALICDFFAVACIDVAEREGIPLVVGIQSPLRDYLPSYMRYSHDYGQEYKDMSFLNRVKDTIISPWIDNQALIPLDRAINNIRTKLGISQKKIFGIHKDALVLSTSFEGIEPATHKAPHFHLVGPLLPTRAQKLSEELKDYVANKGKVIYIGFGSGLIISAEFIERMTKTVINLLQNEVIDGVIWSMGNTPSHLFTPNPLIKFVSWVPQRSLLESGHISVFVSHCGLESVKEAAHAAVAILCIPHFGDQFNNALKIYEAGLGLFSSESDNEMASKVNQLIIESANKSSTLKGHLARVSAISQHQNHWGRIRAIGLLEGHANLYKACKSIPNQDVTCVTKTLTSNSQSLNYFVSNRFDVYMFLGLVGLIVGWLGLFFLVFLFKKAYSYFEPYRVASSKKKN